MQEEIWKNVVGYEGWYSVSNFGRVRRDKIENSTWPGRILIPAINKKGYLRICLRKDKEQKSHSVHRLVLIAFKGYSKLQCNHIDGIKTNNHIDNLEYVTLKENAEHAFRIGLYSKRNMAKGESHCRAKLNEKKVSEIRKLYAKGNISQKEIGIKFKVTSGTIQKIVKKYNWKHI